MKTTSFNIWKMSLHVFHRILCVISGISLFSILTTTNLFQTTFFFSHHSFPFVKKKSNSVCKYSLFSVMKAILWFPITSCIRWKFWTLVHRALSECTNLPAFPFSSQRIFFPDLRQTYFSYSRWTFILELNVILFLIQQCRLLLLKSTRNHNAS